MTIYLFVTIASLVAALYLTYLMVKDQRPEATEPGDMSGDSTAVAAKTDKTLTESPVWGEKAEAEQP